MKRFFTSLILFLIVSTGFGQVVVSPLSENPELTLQFENKTLQNLSANKSLITLHLPFIDDFSKNHQPGSDKVYWENNFVFINPTYGVAPPTIGVATFDGLNFDGYPYNFDSPTAYGEADVLTSCAINLSQDESGDAYAISDSIYLSFFYQPQGLGDSPEETDSLVLEFYDAESDSWTHQWSEPGEDLTSFQLVYIPILDELYLSPDFRFRFRNYATLSGNLDHWHIDMVWMDKNRSTSENGFPDVGFQYPVNQMLNGYTAMPYAHYQVDAESNMIDFAPAELRNNHPNAINLSNVKMLNYSEGMLVNETPYPGNIENFPGQSSAAYDIPVYNGSTGYVFDDNIDEAFVSFNNEFVMTSGTFDLVEDNDTISYIQRFENYYAYDDGSAEAGIGLNQNGGRMVSEYNTVIGDSLFAFKMYFNPIANNPVYPFFMVVYSAGAEGPGELMHIDLNYKEVQYIQEGHDIFAYYFLDSTLYVNGSFYIGISQTSGTSLNLGFDRNIDSHEKIYYNLGANWTPLSESITGSLMMRPVFTSDMDSVILGIDEKELFITSVYPNPANNELTIKTDKPEWIDMEILGIDGRRFYQDRFYQKTSINTQSFANGIYIIRMRSENGEMSSKKIMVQHQ